MVENAWGTVLESTSYYSDSRLLLSFSVRFSFLSVSLFMTTVDTTHQNFTYFLTGLFSNVAVGENITAHTGATRRIEVGFMILRL